MRPLPTAPSADDEISASFMRRLIECIKERTILSAPGYRTKSGPNGTTLEIEPGKRSSSPANDLPYWTFVATKDENDEWHGEWKNKTVQAGYQVFKDRGDFSMIDYTDDERSAEDGIYYIKVELGYVLGTYSSPAITMQRTDLGGTIPPPDFENDVIYIYIGTVRDHVQTDGIHAIPVIYYRI